MFKLYLIRHAQSEANVGKNSSHPNTGLTKVGEEQAKRLANYFKKNTLSLMISSPLERAKATAQFLSEKLTSVPLEFDDLLVERDKGIFAGRPHKEFDNAAKASGVNEYKFKPEQGESIPDVYERAKQFSEKLFERMKKEKLESVTIISHSAFISCLCCYLSGRPWTDTYYFGVKNTSISFFELDDNLNVKDYDISSMAHILKGAK